MGFFDFLDSRVNDFLIKQGASLPMRWRKFLAAFYPDARVRKVCWASLGVRMGEGTYANPGLLVTTAAGSADRIWIGDRVSIGPHVTLISESLPNNSEFLRGFAYVKEHLILDLPIRIEDDAWVGAGVVILPGVTVGRGAIIGAGSVVTRDIPAFTVAAGVPAKPLRSIKEEIP